MNQIFLEIKLVPGCILGILEAHGLVPIYSLFNYSWVRFHLSVAFESLVCIAVISIVAKQTDVMLIAKVWNSSIFGGCWFCCPLIKLLNE